MSMVATADASCHGPFAPPAFGDQDPRRLALEQRLPADHLARRIDRLVEQRDLTGLRDGYAGRGSPAYRPDLLLKVVLYETPLGHPRPADGARHARENEPVRWLLRGCEPSRARWYAFRDRLHDPLDGWIGQVLRQALDDGLTTGTQAALDGTTVAANAARHRLLNHETVQRRRAELDAACAADAQGQAPAAVPAWLARTPPERCRQRERYGRVGERLAQRLLRNRHQRAGKRTPEDKVVISAADPEAALGRDKHAVYRPLYNVPYAYARDAPLILAYEVFAQPNDAGTRAPMLRRVEVLVGHGLAGVLADAGSVSGAHRADAEQAGVVWYGPWQANDASAAKRRRKPPQQLPKEVFAWQPERGCYACPRRHPLELVGEQRQKRSGTETVPLYQYRCAAEHGQACPVRGPCTPNPRAGRTIRRSEHEPLIEALQARMQTEEGKRLYKQRRQTVELGFADLKEHRQVRRLSGRGLRRARIQIGLSVLTHNALQVQNAQARSQPAPTPTEIAA